MMVSDPHAGLISAETGSAKMPWVVRRIPQDFEFGWGSLGEATAGDLLLCTIEKIGLHGRLETREARRAKLYVGDTIVCALANRHATSLLHGVAELQGDHAHMLSASGLCGRVLERSDRTSAPTTLRVLAQAFGENAPINLRSFAMESAPSPAREPVWFLVVGTDMDSGKTSAAAALIRGLAVAGYHVGAAKLTGTASSRDVGAYREAGASPVYDFLDLGWPSTAGCREEETKSLAFGLMDHLGAACVDVGVLEIADGLLQAETAALIGQLRERPAEIRVILTARESLAAAASVERIRQMGFEVAAVSGVVTSSPLARREVELSCAIPCIRTSELEGHAVGLMNASMDKP